LKNLKLNLFEKNGTKDDKDNYTIDKDKEEKFVKLYDELIDTDVEIKQDIIEIDELDGIKVSANALISIEWMLE